MRRLRWLIAAVFTLLTIGTAATPLVGGPRFYAPVSLVPAPGPLTITILAASELDSWIKPAAQAFNNEHATVRGREVTVQLSTYGSGALLDQAKTRPAGTVAALIPASSVWLDLIRRQQPSFVLNDPRSVAKSPLVILAWRERAAALFPGGKVDWARFQAAMADSSTGSWQKYGGKPEWGNVKFAHADPNRANSGLATLQLLLAAQSNSSNLDPGLVNATFESWLRDFESGVVKPYRESSREMINQMLAQGPAVYDAIAVPENLAADQTVRAKGAEIQVVYPQPTPWADYPFTLVTSDPDEVAAAQLFRDFLLARPQQEAALQNGLRPAEQSKVGVAERIAGNVFEASNLGLKAEEPQPLPPPSPETIQALLKLWNAKFAR